MIVHELVAIIGTGLGVALATFGILARRRRRPRTEPTPLDQGVAAGGSGDPVPSAALALEWRESEALLPDGWGTVSVLPAHMHGRLQKIETPYVQALVHGVAEAAPSVAACVGSSHLFRMVGPPQALTGLANDTLHFQLDKGGQQLMNVVDHSGVIRHQPRVVEAGQQLRGAAAAACAFQVLSVATAQYYLHQIAHQLGRIEAKVDAVLARLDEQRHGRLIAASTVVREVYESTLQQLEGGTLPQRLSGTVEFWSRMSHAEDGLRTAIAELEAEYTRVGEGWRGKLGEYNKTKREWFRAPTRKRTEIEVWEDVAAQTDRIVILHTASCAAMAQWYQVVLTYDAMTNSETIAARYGALRHFVGDRQPFIEQLATDRDFFLGREGDSRWDTAADAAALPLTLVGAPEVAKRTDERHASSRASLASAYERLGDLQKPLCDLHRAMNGGASEFIVQNQGTPDRPRLEAYVVQQLSA